jgi:hypothetical protein
VEVRIVNATSDQPESIWYESVKTQDDVTFSDTAVCMRAERSFVDLEDFTTGRTYEIALEFKDSSGNETTELVQVRVPFTFGEEDKETCGDLSLLDWVETPAEEQECFGREGQYPPAPPPPGCLSSIAGAAGKSSGLPLLVLMLSLVAAAFLYRRRH